MPFIHGIASIGLPHEPSFQCSINRLSLIQHNLRLLGRLY